MATKVGAVLRSAWPAAIVGLAVAINGFWIAAIGYGISKLL
jgi:hypothetical protein